MVGTLSRRPFIARLALVLAGAVAWASCAQDRGDVTAPNDQAPSLAAQGNQQGLATAIAAQERHNPDLLGRAGVEGTAVGLTAEGRPAVLVFTRHEGVRGIPQQLDDVPVVVHVSGPFAALRATQAPAVPAIGGRPLRPTSRFPRPVPIGVSTGNEGQCSAGTIGARVIGGGGNVYALSNNHVYALENTADLGSQVLQPGLYDTRCVFDANNVLGTLTAFAPIVFSTSAGNTIDAAIAATTTALLGDATPTNGYGTPASTTVGAFVGQAVQKYGRTTSLTTGTVYGINATVTVGYSTGAAGFVDQIIVQKSSKPFIKAGDSGSLLVTSYGNANPVGLLFAGTQSGSLAVANRIDLVLSYFVVTIDGY